MIFVFGSNLAGIHGAGAAKYALEHKGAARRQGLGHYGESYALPTKDHDLYALDPASVRYYVNVFLKYAQTHPKLEFQVTRVGCGLAGYLDQEIAPLFVNAPDNCFFDDAWKPWLPNKKFWGTF